MWPVIAAIGAQIIGGMMQKDAAEDAAETQAGASREGIAENRRQFDAVRELLAPYTMAGQEGLTGYRALSGLAGRGAQQANIDYLSQSPEFTSLANQGEAAILSAASATGGLRGGNTQDALATFRSNLLTSLIDRQLGRAGDLMSLGQNAAAGVGNAGLVTGARNAALMQQGGAAQAGGILTGAGAMTNAIGGIGGILSAPRPTPTVPFIGPPNPGAGPSFGSGTVVSGDFGGNLF